MTAPTGTLGLSRKTSVRPATPGLEEPLLRLGSGGGAVSPLRVVGCRAPGEIEKWREWRFR